MTKSSKYLAGLVALAGVAFTGMPQMGANALPGMFDGGGYNLKAVFDDVGGLEPGAKVMIAGIRVGTVKSVRLAGGLAAVAIELYKDVDVEQDAVASIRTDGLLGGKYIRITPGGSEKLLADGASIRDTESAIDIESMISMKVCGGI